MTSLLPKREGVKSPKRKCRVENVLLVHQVPHRSGDAFLIEAPTEASKRESEATMLKVLLISAACVPITCIALTGASRGEEQTTVYVQTTIPLDKGKPTVTGGATYSQTRGNTTTTVDVHTDGKNVNVTGSQTTQHR
jgi:hypothetical protein